MSSRLSSKKEHPPDSSHEALNTPVDSDACMLKSLDLKPVRVYVGQFDDEAIEVKPNQGYREAPLVPQKNSVHLQGRSIKLS